LIGGDLILLATNSQCGRVGDINYLHGDTSVLSAYPSYSLGILCSFPTVFPIIYFLGDLQIGTRTRSKGFYWSQYYNRTISLEQTQLCKKHFGPVQFGGIRRQVIKRSLVLYRYAFTTPQGGKNCKTPLMVGLLDNLMGYTIASAVGNATEFATAPIHFGI